MGILDAPLSKNALAKVLGFDPASRFAAIEAFNSSITNAYVMSTAVAFVSSSVTLDITGVSNFPRDLVFTGWGERYAPAGISFNALKIKSISRTAVLTTSRWKTLNIQIRTGVNCFNANSTVVAVGSVSVDESKDVLTDIIVVLKDPVSGTLKTLTDSDFSGNEYMICVFAENSIGGYASCGSPMGTQANSLGQSYYCTATPRTGVWVATSPGSNSRIGFQHLLMTGPVETNVYTGPTQSLVDSITALQTQSPDVIMPPTIYAVQNRECNLYFENLHFGDGNDYFHDVVNSLGVGMQQTERFTWTPTAAATTGTLTLDIYNKRTGVKATSKTTNLRAAASTNGTGLTKKIMVIGDSLVNAGTITQTLLDIAAGDVMGVSLLGTQGTGLNKHEGRGGWTVANYTTAGPTYYDFTVSGVTTSPAINSTEYSHNGSVYRVQTVTLTGGVGTLRCSVTSGGAPLASGTLTKSNGGLGDATITFTASAAAPGNPFWIGGVVNFPQYLTNNSFAVPDWVFIGLGINDCFGQTDDTACSTLVTAQLLSLDTLITSIKAAGASVNVGLLIPTPPSYSQDSFGTNYAAVQTKWRYKRNILIWARQMIAKYSNQEASRIYLVPSNTALDTVNNMNVGAAAAVNSRNPTTVVRQNNGVHPGTYGYQQIGDVIWACVKYNA